MRVPGWMFILGVVLMVGMTALCSVVSFTTAQQFVIDLGKRGVLVSSPVEAIRIASSDEGLAGNRQGSFAGFFDAQPTPTPTVLPPTATPAPGVSPQPTSVPEPTATVDPMADYEWTDPRRFNLLLLGIDQRTGVVDEEKYFRTDTIMVISIDPVRKTAGVLSIPRDLWVSIPGFQEGRINTANTLGDSNALPGGGPALAAATVQQNLGIPVDAYIRINFDVFTSVVNTIAPGGVQVCITDTIDDPNYPDAGYGFIHVHFDPGCQRLDAEKLLQYARTRHTDGGDFDRARRQQEVIRAVQDEVLSAGGIANFIRQIPTLWDELSGSYTTNLALDEIISLGSLLQEIDRDDVRFGVIDNMHVQFATTNTGDQVLVPNYAAIRQLIQETFSPQQDLSLAELRERAEAERARIVVYNNTDIAGLARQTQEWLTSQGISVTNVGNIPEPDGADTVIRNYTDKTWTARYLAALLGLPSDRIERGGDGLTTEDVMVVIGPDIQSLLALAGGE